MAAGGEADQDDGGKKKLASSGLREVMYITSRADSVIIAYDRLAGNNYLNGSCMTEGTLTVIGSKFIKNDQPDEAIKNFTHNIEEYPYAPNPYYYLGETYLMKGENEMAAGNFYKTPEMDPNFKAASDALTKLGK